MGTWKAASVLSRQENPEFRSLVRILARPVTVWRSPPRRPCVLELAGGLEDVGG
jgi:hypothetical protein